MSSKKQPIEKQALMDSIIKGIASPKSPVEVDVAEQIKQVEQRATMEVETRDLPSEKTQAVAAEPETKTTGRPKSEEKKVPKTIYLTRELMEKVRVEAFHKKVDHSEVVRNALELYFAKDK